MSDSVIWVNDVVGHEVGPELNRMEAEQVTAKIKGYVGVAWVLLYEAHNRKAHKAMGYDTWADYVAAEFDMGKSHSYRLISQAKIVIEISEAVSPKGDIDAVSTMVDIDERTARDLKDHVEDAKAAAIQAADALGEAATAAERAEAAKQAVEQVRYDAVERARQRRAEQAAAAEAERLAAELEGQNDDGEVFTGSEPREDAEVSDDEGASTDEGAGSPDPAPSAPADPDAGYRAFIDTALVKWCAVREMKPERVREVATSDQRSQLLSNIRATREWVDALEAALEARPNLKAM